MLSDADGASTNSDVDVNTICHAGWVSYNNELDCFDKRNQRAGHFCTLSFNCVQVQTLPTAQVTPALQDSLSWGYDPNTHARKARPLTTVGWTSLSVIVIVSVANRQPRLYLQDVN